MSILFFTNCRFQFHKRSRHARFCTASQDQTGRERMYRPLQFYKRSQHFIRTHNETLSVAMRVNNPDGSPFDIES
jgi:hypothetical protein